MNIARSSILILALSLHMSHTHAQSEEMKEPAAYNTTVAASANATDPGPANTTAHLLDPEILVNTVHIVKQEQLPSTIQAYLLKNHVKVKDFFAQIIWEQEEFVYLLGVHDPKGVHILTFDGAGLLLSRDSQSN